MTHLPIKDDTKKHDVLANQSQQASDEQLNFQLINTYSEENRQSIWQEQSAQLDFSHVFTQDSLVLQAAVPRKSKASSYQAILTILDELHNSSGTQQIENALILKNQIQHYQGRHASSRRSPALTMLNQQIDKALFSSPLLDQAKILYVAQQNPRLASQMYQSEFNEALGAHTIRSVGVPDNLHFIWQGKFGAIQQDYINAWHQTNPDYQIKIWYDPQALLVHELRKQIEQFARQGQILNESGYFDQILQLQNKAHQAILQGIEQQDKTFDHAATEFMVNQLGSQKQALERIRKENQASYAEFIQKQRGAIQLADINTLIESKTERQYYYRELALRQNLAAASDIVRLKALYQHGGIYIDVDLLPGLKNDFFSKAVSQDIERLTHLPNGSDTIVINLVKTQLILEQLAASFPARESLMQAGSYQDYIAKFKARSPEHASLINRMTIEIKQHGQVPNDFFQPLTAQRLSSDGIRVADINGFSKAVIVSPAGNPILKAALKQFAKNYHYLEQAGLVDINKISEIDEKAYQYLLASEQRNNKNSEDGYHNFSNKNFSYRLDGIQPNNRATTYVTGPVALHQAFDRFGIDLIQDPTERIDRIDLQFTEFNQYTEEEIKHRWLADNDLNTIDLFGRVITSGEALFKNTTQNSKFNEMAGTWHALREMSGSQQVEQIFILREQLQNYISNYQHDNVTNTQKTFAALQVLNQQIDQSLFERQGLPESEIIQLAKQHPEQAARIYQAAFNEARLQGIPADILSKGIVGRSLHSAAQHPEWFNRQDKRVLQDLFLEHFTAEQLLTLPESIFSNNTRRQAENYFSKVVPDTLNDNEFLTYLKEYPGVYRQLSATVDASPLLSRYLRFSSAQRRQVPPEALLSLTAKQAMIFFNGLSDHDLVDYVKKHRASYQHLVEHINLNPLWPRSKKFSLDQRLQVPPDALLLINSKRVSKFFSILNSVDFITYVKHQKGEYAHFVRQVGTNPLLSRLKGFSAAQQIDLPPEALQGITFRQAHSFFKRIGSDLITAAYLEQHKQGLTTLNRRTLIILLSAVTDNSSRRILLKAIEAIPVESHQSDNKVNAFILNALLGNAIRNKDKKFVKLLIKHTQTNVQSALVAPDTAKIIEVLVPELLWTVNESPLFLAIKTQQTDLVKLLLDHQPLSNYDRFEWLCTAISNHDDATLRLLLDAGIYPNSNRKLGEYSGRKTALTEAVDSGDITLVNTLLEYNALDNGEALLSAISHNDITLVERLSEVALYRHLQNKEKFTLYKLASQEAKFKQVLLEKRYKDSTDISERAIIRDAFGRSKNILVIVSQQEIILKRQISPKVYELLSALNPKRLENNTLNGIAPFDDKLVDDWDKPLINSLRENSQTRFDAQLIIQLENDRVVRESATRLVGKHPKTSVLVQLDRQGNFRVWHLNPKGEWGEGFPEKFITKGALCWQVVGHGRSDEITLSRQMLGGRSAETLKKQLVEFSSVFGISTSPERISLVGCSLAGKDQENSFLHQFASFLTERDLYSSSVAAYTTKVIVNEDNQKRLTQIGEKVVMNRKNGEWITARIPGKNDSSASQRQLLDSLNQGLGFEQGMALLYLKNRLSDAEWLPVFQTLKEDTSQEGQYSLEFINKENPTESKIVTTNDSRITNFIHGYDRHLISLKTHIKIMKARGSHRSGTVPEATGVHGLNTAFIIQTLFNKHSRDGVEDDVLPENLRAALKLHSYTNRAQMGWGTVEDTFRYVRLWKELSNESQSLGRTFKVISRASPVGDLGLNLLSIGLNGYELAHAQNDAQRAEYGTQLAFDLAGLVDVVIGLGANSIGATTIASFAGSLGVPLAGLSIGINALVQGTQVHIEKTKAVGRYFAFLDEGYQKGGYQLANVKGEDGVVIQLWKNTPGMAISTLNLRNQKVIFADTWIYKTYIYGLGSGYANNITWVTPKSVNRVGKHKITNPKERVINIREGIGHAAATVSSVLSSDIPLVLPDTPQYYMDYNYETFPGSTTRDDWGFEVLRRLERRYRDNDDNFSFDFYNFPSERAISELSFEYLATPVHVLLDDSSRTIIMPSLPEEAQGKMTYILSGGTGTYYISVQEDAALRLTQGSSVTHWVLDIRALTDTKKLRFDSQGRLLIGQVHISFSDDFQGKLNLLNDDGVLVVNVKQKTIILEKLNVNAHRFNNWQALHDYLRQISQIDSHHQSFIPVEGYRTLDMQAVGRAFYEVERDRFIYTNEPGEAEFLSDIQLGKVESDRAWFYRDDKIWLVDITTGNVLLEYLPLNRLIGRTFIKDVADKPGVEIIPTKSHLITGNDDILYFIVEYQYDSGPVSYVWQLTKQAQQLIAITGDEKDIQKILLLIAQDDQYAPPTQFAAEQTVPAIGGEQIHLLGRQSGISYHSWVKKSAGVANYQVFLRMNLANAPEDIQQVSVNEGNKTSYYFYSPQLKKLYFQQDDGITGKDVSAAHEIKSAIQTLFVLQGQLIVQGEDGILWGTGIQGKLNLMGVTVGWLLKHRQDLMVALRELVERENTVPAIRLQGLTDTEGNIIMTWYDVAAEKIIQSGAGIDVTNDIHYRGLSLDGDQAWLYDNASGRLYRQPLRQDNALTITAQGQSSAAIPPSERWLAGPYRSVVSAGDKLRLTTEQGAILLLDKAASPHDQPLLIAWQVTAAASEMELAAAVEALRGKVILAPAIRWLSEKGQTPVWYLTEQKILLHAENLNTDHDLRYLGQIAGDAGSYIHDQFTGELWQVGGTRLPVSVGKYRFVLINENQPFKGELVLQYALSDQVLNRKLPLLEETDRLAITNQTDGAHYFFDSAILNHYEQIILDERGKQPVILLPDHGEEGFQVRLHGQDLVWYVPQSKSQIWMVGIEQAGESGMMFKIGDIPQLPAKQLLQSMARLQAVSSADDDWFKLSFAEGHYQLNEVERDHMMNQYQEMVGTDTDDNYRVGEQFSHSVITDSGGGDDTLSLRYENIKPSQLILQRQGDDLEIVIIGSGRVTIKNQFKQGECSAIETLKLVSQEQNLQYSLTDAMSSFNTGETFGLSTTGSLFSKHDMKMPICNSHNCHINDLKQLN